MTGKSFIGQKDRQMINGLEFVLTCCACPEQYDVFKDGKIVGYIRNRWGKTRIDCPNCGKETIYHEVIDIQDNRGGFLTMSAELIYKWLDKNPELLT